jgi:acid phosphatase
MTPWRRDYEKADNGQFQAGDYTATGSLAFLKEWRTVLTNPTVQMSMESPTGAKEAQDLGYTLRTR